MQLAQINCLKTFKEGMVVYTVLIGEPASGKSPAMSIVRNSLVRFEDYLKIDLDNSKLVNGEI